MSTKAIDNTETKGDTAKGQFGYGAVLEEGNQEENPHEPAEQGCVGKNKKTLWGLLGLLLTGTAIALLVLLRPHEKTPEEQFEEYVVRFKKSYADDSERSFRFENFKNNLLEIVALNQLDGNADFGWNLFTDFSREEFASRFLGREPIDNTNSGVTTNSNLRDSPSGTKKDWTAAGKVPPVRDQGYCGSCWAHATVASIETAYVIANGADPDDVEFSVQALVSCDTDGWNGGCNGGDPPGAFDWIMDNGGLPSESNYPFTSGDSGSTGSCSGNEGNVVAGTDVKSWSYATEACFDSCNSQDEDTMAASVEDYGPITVCVNANNWQYYTGGIMSAKQCGRSGYYSLNHCVQLTGFDISASDSDDHYWILRNSWAEDWGEDGYMRVSYNENTCGVADEAIYVELED